MSKAVEQASDLSHNSTSTYQRATVTTPEVLAIPAEWVGKYVEFTAIAQDVYVRFGTSSSVTCDPTTVSAVASFVMTATPNGAHLVIPAGQSRHERIHNGWTHLAHDSTATGGVLFMNLATGDGA